MASTGAALPYNIALGSGLGVLSLSAASGTTPSTVQLSITPPVVAGVYQYSIVLTSATAAFAPVTIPVILTVTGASSGTGALQCTNYNPAPTVRNEGIGEFIGDTVLSCTGGTPTAAGAAVTAYDVQLTLTTPVTSRSYANNWSEALLIVDEPTTGLAGSPSALLACNDPTGICAITGTGTGIGTYGGTTGRPNVFPGRISGNVVTFSGVPIDPAPLGSSRILRITNVRTDVSGVAASGSAPGTVSGTVSVGSLTVTKATAPVAYVTPGLASSVRKADDSAAAAQRIDIFHLPFGRAAAGWSRALLFAVRHGLPAAHLGALRGQRYFSAARGPEHSRQLAGTEHGEPLLRTRVERPGG